jgi:hypothetical protein
VTGFANGDLHTLLIDICDEYVEEDPSIRECALQALRNLSWFKANCPLLVEGGAIPVAVNTLSDELAGIDIQVMLC